MDEVEFDNKKYISSKRASKITGYSNDYIGQLVRSGDIEGRKIGKTWFIEAKSLLKYQYDKQVVKSGNKNTTTSSSLFARLPSIQQNKTLTLVVSMFAVVILITSSVYLAGGKEVITKQISALKESTVNDIGGVKEVAQVWVDNIDIYKTSVARAVEKTNTSLGTLKIKTTQKISKLKNHIADVFNDMESNTVNIIADATGKSKIFASMAYVKTKTIVLNTYNSTKKTINGSLEQTSEFLASANTEATKSTFSNFTTSVKDKIKLWIGIFNTKDKIPDKKPAQEDLKLADIKLQQQPETKNTPQAPIQKITINKPIEKVTVEKTIERIISGVTKEDLESRIQQLNNKLASEIARVADAASRTGRSNFKTIALTNKIDNLSNITVNGVTGLTDSDIPDTITVSNYLRLSGGTLTGAFAGTSGTFSTNFGVGTTSPSDTLAVDGQVYLAQVSAPAVTANRLYNSSGTLYWNGTALGGGGGGGSGSFTQSAGFIYNSTTTDQILLGATATTSTQKLEVIGGGYFFGNVGIGTTSPYAKLSVVGETVAEYFTATSTSATTTLAGGLDVGGGVFNYDSSSSKIILNAPNAIDGAMEITISASGFAQSTSGLKITGTNLGTISKAKGIVLDIDDTGANSYGLYMTGSARHGFYYSSTQTGFFRGINIINDSISSGLSDAKWFSAESSSTSLGDEAVLYRGVLSGATTAGRFLSFENSDNAADVFVVNNDGNVGIATSSPYAKLSVVGETVAEYFTATSTSATSTFGGNLSIGSGKEYRIDGVPVLWGNSTTEAFNVGVNTVSSIGVGMGLGNTASNIFSVTTGINNTSSGVSAVAVGISNTSSGDTSFAFGHSNKSQQLNSSAFGYSNLASGQDSSAFGASSTANSLRSSAFGYNNIASNNLATAIGYANTASGANSSAFGYSNIASAQDSVAFGRGNNASAIGSFAFGNNITNNIANSTMFGPSDTAKATILSSGNFGIGTTSPYAKLSVVGETVAEYFTATSTSATSTFWGKLSAVGNIGIGGVYVDANRGINYSSVDPSAITYGTYRILNIGTSNDIYGTYNSIINDGDSTTKAYGLYNSISNTGTGGYQTSYGVYNSLTGGTTGEVLIGLYNNITIGTGANSGEKAYGVYTVDGNSGGSSSNIVYGSYIDIDDPTTTNYSIYVESGSGISYFGSNVGIGTTSPYAKLSVVGETVAEYFTATSTTATTTLAGGLNVDSGTLSVDYSAGTVGVGVTPASVGKLKVGGAGYFTSENNAFGSGSAYTSLVLGDASSASGALFAFDDGTASSPYVGLSGYSTGSERGLYFGGGGWDVADANAIYFYVDPTYSSSGDTNGGILAMKIFPDGGVVIGSGVPTAANDGVLNVYRNFNDIDVTFQNAIEAKYAIGYDHSEDSFKISKGDTLGVNDRFTIVSSGNIGIGTSSPYAKLSVAGNAAFSGLSNDGTGYYLCLNTTTYEMSTSTTACGASSERFKQNIQDISYGLDDVLKLRPVSFDWKKDFIQNGSKQIGFIAEEVESIIPEIVGYDNEGKVMNLDYPKLTSVLAKAIQEQQGQIEKLSEYIKGDTVELDGSGESAFWSIDNTSGRIKYITPLDLNGFDIINVSAIVGTMSRWSIDASGRLVVDEVSANKVTTNILCVDDICIDKEKFKEIFADNVTVTTQTADTANSMDVEGNNNSDGISSDAEDTATTTDTETVQSDEDNTTNNNTSTTTDPTAGTVQDIQTSTTTSMTDTTLDPVLGCTDSDANNYNKDATKDDNSCTYPDTTPPIITLNGESTIELTVGDVYSEDGATAEDDIDGDITDNIIVSGDMVDTATAGIYTITYDVSDDAGNSALKVKRVVTVIEPVQVGTDINTVQ